MLTRLGRLLVAASVAASLLAATSTAVLAGPESDIPGVPLPGAVATGQLGGPIYDVVYRLTVDPGYVIVAGLTGTPGTDFDIYLFDSTATTVLSNAGLLAKSIGPTSSEHLSYPSFAGGTYYIDLNGASDVEGAFTLTVQLVADTSTPVASLLLANGQPTVNSTTVTVELTASSQLSGVSQMAFSADGVTFGPWQAYTIQTSWTFDPGDGRKTLWAKVRNGVGTESVPVSDSVVLDTQPPTVTSLSPGPADPVVPDQTYRVGFSEPIVPASWASAGMVIQAANGVRVQGSTAYDAATRTGTFTPSEPLMPGASYVVTVGPVTDLAGNTLAGLGSWVVVPLFPTSLGLSASTGVVLPGTSVRLSGTASGLDGQDVILETRLGSSSEVSATGPYQPAAGSITLDATPAMNTWYRLRYVGSRTMSPSSSPEVRVLVRRTVSLLGSGPGVTRSAVAGRAVTITAQIGPTAPAAKLSFRLYRYDPARRTYRYAGSFGRTSDAAGRASLTWAPSAGRYYWRVAVLPTPEFANNISALYRWTVTGR